MTDGQIYCFPKSVEDFLHRNCKEPTHREHNFLVWRHNDQKVLTSHQQTVGMVKGHHKIPRLVRVTRENS